MIKLDRAVIVEGKYDKITLSNFISAEIITTDGFRIFKDKEKTAMIKRIAEKRGIIILTDSDSAGFVIRGYLNGIVPQDRMVNVFVPQIKGKERRKTAESAEGYLGVEGLNEEIIEKALKKAGIGIKGSAPESKDRITTAELYKVGFLGRENSRGKREALMKKLELPKGMSTKQLLTALNAIYSKEEFLKVLEEFYEK